MNLNPSADYLTSAIQDAETFVNTTTVGIQPGQYTDESNANIKRIIAEAKNFILQTGTSSAYDSVIYIINGALNNYKKNINLPITSTNTEDIWYTLHTPLRESRYLTSLGINSNLRGDAFSNGAASQLWKFVRLNDGTISIMNKQDKNYISTTSAYNTSIQGISTGQTSNAWSFVPTYSGLTFAISSGAVQLNQTGSGLGYQIYNWGGGSNMTDTGCKYQITEVKRTTTGIESIFIQDNHLSEQINITNRKITINSDIKDVKLFNIDGRNVNLQSTLSPGIYILCMNDIKVKIIIP